jgi:streptogramin lyase
VQRIDPDAADPIAATESTGGAPTGIAVGEGAAWITTGFGTVNGSSGAGGELYKFDPRSDHVIPAVALSGGKALAVGDGFVWVADDVNDRVVRIDPKTGHTDTIPVGSQPVAIAIGSGENSPVWVANAVDATVSRIDPRSERVESFDVGGHPSGVAVDKGGGVWVTSSVDNTVTRLDATGHTVATITGVPTGPVAITASGENVWVAGSLSHSIARIDPRTNKVVNRLTVSGTPTGIAVDTHGDVWVTVGAA